MGCWDVYCTLCGCPLNSSEIEAEDILEYNPELTKEQIKEISKISQQRWLKRCTLICKDGRVLKNFEEVGCGNYFRKIGDEMGDEFEVTPGPDPEFYGGDEYGITGIVVHSACYRLIQREKGISLKYYDFVERYVKYKNYLCSGENYDLGPFQRQDFDFVQAFLYNKNLLKSPSFNKIKANNVLKIFSNIQKSKRTMRFVETGENLIIIKKKKV